MSIQKSQPSHQATAPEVLPAVREEHREAPPRSVSAAAPQPDRVTLATPPPQPRRVDVTPTPTPPPAVTPAPPPQPDRVPPSAPLHPVQSGQSGRKPQLPSPSKLITIKNQAVSRRNFAKLLSVHTFSEEERRVSNVNGRQGKQKLSPNRTDELKAAVFRLYPLEPRENEATAWKDCVRAIDEGNRKLPK